MATTEEVYKQSRKIRKLVEEGKTIKEIAKQLSLTKAKILYRIESKYSTKVATQILQKLKENEEEFLSEEKKSTQTSETALVIDSCALKHANAFEVIQRFSKVILITDVIKELDRLKEASDNVLRNNVKRLLRECAQKENSQQFIVEVSERVSGYTDENLIQYCKGKNVVLYTSDYALASLAKGYKIDYLLGEEEEQKEIHTAIVKEAINTISRKNNVSLEGRIHALDNAELVEGKLILTIPDTDRICYIVLTKNELQIPDKNGKIKLEVDSSIFVLTYKLKHNGLCISNYRVLDIKEQDNVEFIRAYKPKTIEQIKQLDLPSIGIKKVIEYFYAAKTMINK